VEPTDGIGFIKQVVGILLTGLLAVAAIRAEPVLEIDRTEFDFGGVPTRGTLVHRTWLKSTGEDTLVIADIKTGCACLAGSLEKNRLAPGDSVMLALFWRVGGSEGRLERVPYLFGNDKVGTHRLKLRAEIVPADKQTSSVYCRPMKIEFMKSEKRKDYRRLFTIHNATDSVRAVNLTSYAEAAYRLELPDSVAARGSATGVVILAGDYADKEFEGSFTLEFPGGDGAAPRVTTVVSRGDFSFRPSVTTSINTPVIVNSKR